MPIKRKTRNLPNDDVTMSFFDPVYQNDLLDSNETLDADTITNNDQEESSEIMSTSKIFIRIKQIQNSIEQARTMLESMENFKDLPNGDQQREKLYTIISNLEEQQAGYANLLNLITLTAEERAAISNARPRIESKIGFIHPTTSSSDNEQTNHNENSNYDSLVGSLKSDTINWKDQQSTSDDGESDVEDEKEIERNLMIQKEQLRALQGQKRALLALKRRSERHLIEQQQLTNKKSAIPEENHLLSHINSLRNRLKLLRNIYEQKHQMEIEQSNSSKKPQIPTENRLKNLEHVRERLDELEQIIGYYQNDEEQSDDAEPTTNNNTPKHLDKLSSELTAKRLELEQAKSALSQLQEMVKTIHPDEYSSSARSTPSQKKSPSKNNNFEVCTEQVQTEISKPNLKSSLLSNILSPNPTTNNYANVKMTAQHREIERLVESRQRLHTIKDQISSLHQSMTTPPIESKKNSIIETNNYEENLNDSKNLRPLYRSDLQDSSSEDENQSELGHFEYESDNDRIQTKPRMKQSNFCVSENILPKQEENSDELNIQMREICRCLSTFIDEQKSFNRHIEQRLTTATNPPSDPVFNQLQQQVLTQGLIVNLNTAYREIAVLQSEINALQSENNRLASSISFDHQYHQHNPHLYERTNSKESIYSFNQTKPNNRPRPRSTFDEQQNHLLTTNNLLENSSKTSFNSQSSGKQTAIHVDKIHVKTTPIKHERNATFATEYLSSPKPQHFQSKQKSDIYDLPNHHRRTSKENTSKSFIIHRRPLSTENKNNRLYNYKQKLDEQSTLSSLDDFRQQQTFDDSEDEQQLNTVFSIQPSTYYTTTTQNMENIDLQTLDLQVKSAMVQLIPFMRLHINEVFNESILNHIRERIIFLFKQQPDSSQLIRYFQNQFSELLEKTIEKYCGTTIRECAADLIRDMSDVAFDELIKYKIYENTLQPNLVTQYYAQQASPYDDGENENKYQIELAESENRPLTLIGSDEEDNDSDQEENKDNELETAVSRQESDHHESPISSESNSNGHEYVLVNRSTSNEIVPENEDLPNA